MFSTLSNWLEDETFLIKCLTPTMTSISCNTARSSLQDNILSPGFFSLGCYWMEKKLKAS